MENLEYQIEKALEVLQFGGSILYPTDTVWGLGCDATNEKSVECIYTIKQRSLNKSMIVLVDSMQTLKKYVEVPFEIETYLKKATRPTSVIYKNPKGIAFSALAKDNTIAIRIVQDVFCQKLINKFGKPIVSTSANISGVETPKSFSQIDTALLERVDWVVDYKKEQESEGISSRLIRFSNGEIEVLR